MKATRRLIGAATVLAAAGALAVTAPTAQAAPVPGDPRSPITCNDPFTGLDFDATVLGTPESNLIWAPPGTVIASLGGDDIVNSNNTLATMVVVCLGPGNDWFGGNGGVMSPGQYGVRGEDGPDTVFGGAQADMLLGGNGNDTIDGMDGDDELTGDAGNDSLVGGKGHDTVDGGPGIDRCDAEIEYNCEL